MVEGTADTVGDALNLECVADAYESKYGPHFVAPDGNWSGLGNAMRQAEVPVYRVRPPARVLGFGKGETYSQTRWLFS